MKLYYSPGACSVAVHIVLEEIGAVYETEQVLILKGENLADPFLKINPRGQVPVITDGPFAYRETAALLLQLSLSHPEAQLLPAIGTSEFAHAVEWLSWISTSPHIYLVQFWRPYRLATSAGACDEIAQQARRNFEACCTQIEESVQTPWFLGEQYTAVDSYLMFCFRQGNRIGLSMTEKYPKFSSWAERMLLRPAVKCVFEREEINLDGDRDKLPPQRAVTH